MIYQVQDSQCVPVVEYLIEYFFMFLYDSPHVWCIKCLITFFSAVTWHRGMCSVMPPQKWNRSLSQCAEYSSKIGFNTQVLKGCFNNPKSDLTLLQKTSCAIFQWHELFSGRQETGGKQKQNLPLLFTTALLLSPALRDFLCLTDQCQFLLSPGGCKHSLPGILQFDRHSSCSLLTPSTSLQTQGCYIALK